MYYTQRIMKTEAHWGELNNINQPGKYHCGASVEIWKLESIKTEKYTDYLPALYCHTNTAVSEESCF